MGELPPPRGWRVLEQTLQRVTFAAKGDSQGWSVVTVEERDGRWRVAHGAYGQRIMPTRRQWGHLLRLEWAEDEFIAPTGEHPRLALNLINERPEHWVDDGGEYWASATLIEKATGLPLPSEPLWIAGTGRFYDLAPGRAVSLPVALAIDPAVPIPPGLYEIRASVSQLALDAPPGRLRVRG